jgi:GT2 family glycosyltransferase
MLAQCIESVQQQTYPCIDLEILDNASSDDSVSFLREYYPHIPLTLFDSNLGFARAHNYAMQRCKNPYYMPLNPDVILTPSYIAEMVRAIELHERVGSVSGKILLMQKDRQKTNKIYSTGHLLARSRAAINRGYKKKDIGQYNSVDSIFAPNGAAPLYRHAMLEDIAINGEYFCEDFFMYMEDHDLGCRAKLRDWTCLYTPYALSYHMESGTGGIRAYSIRVQYTRNRYLTLLRNDCLRDVLIDIPYILLYEFIWQITHMVTNPKRVVAHWQGIIEAILAAPHMLSQRRIIQQRRRASDKYIRSFFVSQLW